MDKNYRKTILAGNWKMNQLASAVPAFVEELTASLAIGAGEEAVLCVPFPFIPAMAAALENSGVKYGAQDVSAQDSGAYTGEVSGAMLKDLGVSYTIIGHSERRAYHGESDALVNGKLKALLKNDITPILCVGESLEQRDAGQTLAVVASQVREGLRDITAGQMPGIVIAYEPIWAIGTGRTATAEQAEEVCAHIRAVLGESFGTDAAKRVSILYGGSMNGKNAAELLAQPDIDGGLIGGASLKPAEFAGMIRTGSENG